MFADKIVGDIYDTVDCFVVCYRKYTRPKVLILNLCLYESHMHKDSSCKLCFIPVCFCPVESYKYMKLVFCVEFRVCCVFLSCIEAVVLCVFLNALCIVCSLIYWNCVWIIDTCH